MDRFVADLGNTRLKLARVASDGRLVDVAAWPIADALAWPDALDRAPYSDVPAEWWVSSVNPLIAELLLDLLGRRPDRSVRLLDAASEVAVRHRLTQPQRTGADRALAVHEALARHAGTGPGQVVCCGTAITVEWIDPDGIWLGGAIAPGLGLAARALNQGTAQLPHVPVSRRPDPWGASTVPAIAAGVYWGCVGAIRVLLERQAGSGATPWRVWTGGDADLLSAGLEPTSNPPDIVPDLVLEGLARLMVEHSGAEVP